MAASKVFGGYLRQHQSQQRQDYREHTDNRDSRLRAGSGRTDSMGNGIEAQNYVEGPAQVFQKAGYYLFYFRLLSL